MLTFVGEKRITVANSANDGASDEHDTDTDTETDNNFSELREVPLSCACTARSGRVVSFPSSISYVSTTHFPFIFISVKAVTEEQCVHLK